MTKTTTTRSSLHASDIDDTIRDAAYGIMAGCEEEDVDAELTRRGFTGEQVFLLAAAGRLLAETIKAVTPKEDL